ncbi:TerD family protein [Kitasatospora sp. NPDC051170]|uniref:TerD family protein n=1 Tax=Kitasatospora sp. NPDC051170 TaxID=3364056 RepID=UPI003797BC8C
MTHVMAKGANIALPAAAVRAVLRWSDLPGAPDVDASALLLGTDGRVRSDSDFVFYNQPRHPSGLVRHLPKQHTAGGTEITDTVEVELAKLPATVDRVVLAGSSEGGPFRAVPGLFLLLFDVGAGEGAPPVAEFAIVDAENVTALVAGELYRRDGGWKFRAIGQGYTSGLIGLATDFGITVDDEEARAAEPAPVTNSVTNGATNSAPTAAVDPRATPVPAPRTSDPDTFRLPAANPPGPAQNTPAQNTPAQNTPPQNTQPQNTPPQNTPANGPATPPPPTIAPPPPSAPPTMPPAAPPTPPPTPAPGGYGYPPAPAPTNYGHPNSGGYGYPGPAQPYPPQPPATGYGQPNTGGYGYPPHGTGHQPPVQPPTQPPAPPATQPVEEFALPPQGPQFQPR